MRRLPLLEILTLIVAPAGCGGGAITEPGLIETSGWAITGGTPDEGHPAVGILVSTNGSGRSLCSATLVGRQSVIAAGHCVPSNDVQFWLCPGISECTDENATVHDDATVYEAASVVRHPGWIAGDVSYDIALISLDRPVADVEPEPINVDPPDVSEEITLVGFGKPVFGTRRVATNAISALGGTQFQFRGTEAVVDEGDSGGPSFVDRGGSEALAGVHSSKQVAQGPSGVVIVATDIRVDPFYSWIVDVFEGDVAIAGLGLPQGGNLPDKPAAEGESCLNRRCAANLLCTPVSGPTEAELGRFCMEGCSTASEDPTCEGGEICTESSTMGLVCFASNAFATGFTSGSSTPSTPTPDPTPAPPETESTPQTEPAAEPSVSAAPETDIDASGNPAPEPAGLAFGELCQEPNDCQSALCVLEPSTGAKYCTDRCTGKDACEDGATCLPAAEAGQNVCGPPLLEDGATPLRQGQQLQQSDTRRIVGGCAMAETGPAPAGFWAFFLLAVAVALRAPRRPRSHPLDLHR